MAGFFTALIYQPIYNALAFLISIVPGGDVGIAIILITILVRLVLFPLSLSAIKSQMAMRQIDPILRNLREEYKDRKDELAKKTMELFKEHRVNPFAGILLLVIQLPIIIGLYTVLRSEAKTLSFDPSMLYPFVHAPEHASLIFLGFLDLTGKSIVLAVLVAATQFLYARLLAPAQPRKEGEKKSFQDDLSESMQLQMRYVLPVVLGVVSYAASSAIALYFLASNVFSVLQELVVQKLHGKR
jgi:YidC/Oxa1 family membrane protein insertase